MAVTAVQESGEVRAVFDEEVSGSGATYYVFGIWAMPEDGHP